MGDTRRAMPQRNVELLKQGFYDEWTRGEYPVRSDLWDPDGELVFSDEFPDSSAARGMADRRKVLEDWLGAWRTWRMEVDEFVAEGDFVLLLNVVRGAGKGSGVEVETTGAHVWELRDGKVVGLTIYLDRDRARREMAGKVAERG